MPGISSARACCTATQPSHPALIGPCLAGADHGGGPWEQLEGVWLWHPHRSKPLDRIAPGEGGSKLLDRIAPGEGGSKLLDRSAPGEGGSKPLDQRGGRVGRKELTKHSPGGGAAPHTYSLIRRVRPLPLRHRRLTVPHLAFVHPVKLSEPGNTADVAALMAAQNAKCPASSAGPAASHSGPVGFEGLPGQPYGGRVVGSF